MNTASRMVWCALGVLSLSCSSVVAKVAQPAGDGSTPEGREALVECVDGLYQFLPGEVNFCLAVRNTQRGRYTDAVQLLKLASTWANKKAQYALGLMYFNGDHVTPDRSLGLAWLSLAAERHDPTYEAVLRSAYGKATPAERDRASALLVTMWPVYADAVAARKAKRRFDRGMRELTRYEPYPSVACIPGVTGGHLDPQPSSAGAGCPSTSFAVARLTKQSDAYFEGWQGHVTVGPLQPQK